MENNRCTIRFENEQQFPFESHENHGREISSAPSTFQFFIPSLKTFSLSGKDVAIFVELLWLSENWYQDKTFEGFFCICVNRKISLILKLKYCTITFLISITKIVLVKAILRLMVFRRKIEYLHLVNF